MLNNDSSKNEPNLLIIAFFPFLYKAISRIKIVGFVQMLKRLSPRSVGGAICSVDEFDGIFGGEVL